MEDKSSLVFKLFSPTPPCKFMSEIGAHRIKFKFFILRIRLRSTQNCDSLCFTVFTIFTIILENNTLIIKMSCKCAYAFILRDCTSRCISHDQALWICSMVRDSKEHKANHRIIDFVII